MVACHPVQAGAHHGAQTMHAPIAAPCFGSKLSSQMDDVSSSAPAMMPRAGDEETTCSALPLTDAKEWCNLQAGQCEQL